MLTTPSRTARRAAARAALIAVSMAALSLAQPVNPLSPPANGPRRADPTWHALRNATVHVKPGTTLEHATVVMRDGSIQAVLEAQPGPDGKAGTPDDVAAPAPMGPRIWDCTGLHIYAGFIDPYVEVDAPPPDADSPGLHWSAKVTPQRKATDGKGIDERSAERLRNMGFAAAAISPRGGIFRGRSAVVSLATASEDASLPRPPVYRQSAYHSVTLDTGRGGRGGGPRNPDAPPNPATPATEADPDNDKWPSYPGSQMGSIALIRQTLIDADWQMQTRTGPQTGAVNALEALMVGGRQDELAAQNAVTREALLRDSSRGTSGNLPPKPGEGQPGAGAAPALKGGGMPFLFSVEDELEALRAVKIAAEFHRPLILLGSGLEFRRLPAIVEACSGKGSTPPGGGAVRHSDRPVPIVLPLNFPKAPDVATIGASESVELRELMTWEQAPTNPRRLYGAGLTVALTTAKLREGMDFRKNLARALRYGLDEDAALAMLTTNPAQLLGVSDRLGTVEKGKAANLIVCEGSLFVPEKAPKGRSKKDEKKAEAKEGDKAEGEEADKPEAKEPETPAAGEGRRGRGGRGGRGGGGFAGGRGGGGGGGGGDAKDSKIRDMWIDGFRHEVNPAPAPELAGTWSVTTQPSQGDDGTLEIDAENAITIKTPEHNVKAQSSAIVDRRIAFVVDCTPLGGKGFDTLSGVIEGESMYGTGVTADGTRYTWKATKTKAGEKAGAKRGETFDQEEPFLGTWKIFEADGKAAKEGDPTVPTLIIGGDGIVVIDIDGKRAHSKSTKIEGGRMEYIYDNAPFGKSFDWVDTLTVDGDVLNGTSKLPNGNTHTWKARRTGPGPGEGKAVAAADKNDDKKDGKKDEKKEPVNRQTMTGKYLVVTVDDRPHREFDEQEAYVEIRDDRTVTFFAHGAEMKATDVKLGGDTAEYTVDLASTGAPGVVKVKARRFGDLLLGSLSMDQGTHRFNAARVAQVGKDPEKNDQYEDLVSIASIPEAIAVPFGPYALERTPPQDYLIVKNTTVWTSAEQGVLKDGVVMINEGKIVFVGDAKAWQQFSAAARFKGGFREIDAKGKHITAGLIDCHSHTGISRGVNEGGQAVTAEVRIEDVTNPDAISWYRQLAGGITAVNNLHGSANPIGGQNCVNKNRWGALHPDDLHLTGVEGGAIPGIKFALGENVKRSNSTGADASWRYPQTRMGVESIIRDRFTAAREYGAQWKAWKGKISAAGATGPKGLAKQVKTARAMLDDIRNDRLSVTRFHPIGAPANVAPTAQEHAAHETRVAELEQRLDEHELLLQDLPHRDLELEALSEILDGKRLVHCHSYRADEILMLARLSKEFGFKLGTYQHGLECYKVATEVKESSIGASIFSDWWGYKVEVQDAIPQAGPILFEQGVVVSFNSDSDELARRMNTEASKAVRYGGVKPEEALKFVTINPAKQLRIDHRVGSLEKGKDADIAIWSGDPLSVYSRCEATYVDGRCLFSLEQDRAHRGTIARERSRLMQKALFESVGEGKGADNKKDEKSDEKPEGDKKTPTPGNREADRLRLHYLDKLARGIHPDTAMPGECGCELD